MPARKTDAGVVAVLEHQIVEHQRLYDAGAPEITDREFDNLVAELAKIDPMSPALKHLGLPPVDGKKFIHRPLMLSLDKVYDLPALTRWFASLPSVHSTTSEGQTKRTIVQPKYDGLALSLTYEDGRLVAVATRGDGSAGEEVTGCMRWAAATGRVQIPLQPQLSVGSGTMVVRGELVMPITAFTENYAAEYANPRNLVAGLVARVERSEALLDTRFVAYDVLGQTIDHLSQYAKLCLLEHAGFDVGPWEVAKTYDDLHPLVAADWRSKVPYELDGVVIKADEAEARTALGETAHHPRWAIAWKYQGESGTTTLEGIEWSISRTGALTPVAVMKPVELSGATITRATLHNAATLVDLAPNVGATIVVTRRGGVIPHVESAKRAPGGASFKVPTACPSCGAAAAWSARGTSKRQVDVYCTCPLRCPGVLRERVKYWCKTTGMLGIGPEFIDKMVESCGVANIHDLYTLKVRTLRDAGFGPRQTAIILEEIEKTTTLEAATFIEALGLTGVGPVSARAIARVFDWEKVDLKTVPHGVNRVDNVIAQVGQQRALIDQLLVYIRIEDSDAVVRFKPQTAFTGKTVVFTGSLSDMTRDEAQALVRSFGGETPSSLLKSTSFLVVGDHANPSQLHKRTKAQQYNQRGAAIKVITESEFIEMLAAADNAVEKS